MEAGLGWFAGCPSQLEFEQKNTYQLIDLSRSHKGVVFGPQVSG